MIAGTLTVTFGAFENSRRANGVSGFLTDPLIDSLKIMCLRSVGFCWTLPELIRVIQLLIWSYLILNPVLIWQKWSNQYFSTGVFVLKTQKLLLLKDKSLRKLFFVLNKKYWWCTSYPYPAFVKASGSFLLSVVLVWRTVWVAVLQRKKSVWLWRNLTEQFWNPNFSLSQRSDEPVKPCWEKHITQLSTLSLCATNTEVPPTKVYSLIKTNEKMEK